MKVCIVTGIYPPEIGGPATHVPEISQQLIKNGHKVVIVTYGLPKFSMNKGVKIFKIPYPKLPKFLAFPLRIVQLTLLLNNVIKKENIDVLYIQDPSIAGIPSVMSKLKHRKPIILRFIGDWAWELSFSKGWTKDSLERFYLKRTIKTEWIKYLQKIIINKCDRIIVPSNYLKRILILNKVKPKIKIIPNAINTNITVQAHKKRKRLLCVGRLVPWKNFDKVVKIMPRIIKKNPEVKLLIVGDGPELTNLKQLSKKLKVNKNIKFLGRLPRKDVLKLFSEGGIVILPSLYEGMSHVLLEAQLHKCPVIVSRYGGNPETIINKKTGFVINNNLERVILKLLDENKYRTMGEEGHKLIKQKNNWDTFSNELIKLIKQVTD